VRVSATVKSAVALALNLATAHGTPDQVADDDPDGLACENLRNFCGNAGVSRALASTAANASDCEAAEKTEAAGPAAYKSVLSPSIGLELSRSAFTA